MREVPLTPALQQQINKDVALKATVPGYGPRWVFLDAPSSAELQRALDEQVSLATFSATAGQLELSLSRDLKQPQNAEGRMNPALEAQGYSWVEAQEGENNIRVIAEANSADVAETVMLNLDHISRADEVFKGYRIYLPE